MKKILLVFLGVVFLCGYGETEEGPKSRKITLWETKNVPKEDMRKIVLMSEKKN